MAGCPKYYPESKTDTTFWRENVRRNRIRRWEAYVGLEALGLHVVEIWEHEAYDADTIVCKGDAPEV